MPINEKFGKLADDQTIQKTIAALKGNGIEAFVMENAGQAKQKLLELLPEGAEVMNMTSTTLETISVVKEVLESGRYNPVRKVIKTNPKLGSAPDWAIGSVHAVTQDGSVAMASATGSQLPAHAYGAKRLVWVVGAQKIVKNMDEAIKRLYEYALPLEDVRARKVYGMGSGVNKILVINKEVQPGRITIIFVKEKLGF